MPARTTKHQKRQAGDAPVVIFVHASGTRSVDEAWLGRIAELDAELFSHAPLAGARATRNHYGHLGALLAELAEAAPGKPVLLLRAGIEIDRWQLAGLLGLLQTGAAPAALTALSNADPTLNPFAGLSAANVPDARGMAAAVRVMGRRVLHTQTQWPGHALLLGPAAAGVLAGRAIGHDQALAALQSAGPGLVAPEWLFLPDAHARPFEAARLEPHESARPAAWGALAAHLQGWLDAGAPAVTEPGAEARPVTLHVTHSWGGGVGLWTEAFIAADTAGDHLQLRSEEAQSGQGAGQRLALYLGNELRFPVASWWLQPPIESISAANSDYREVLAEIRERFGVGRVLVSSLIGHSLDALGTGLPTLQVLHDYFPVWPLFSVHPADYLAQDGQVDLAKALADHRRSAEFRDHDAQAWVRIKDAYLDMLEQHRVQVVAPSQSVVDLQNRLDPRWRDFGIQVVPHGLPPLASARPVLPRPRADQRLRLVVMGRIQPGKGQRLLREALPELTRHAQVYLLGTGKQGESFFGQPGVSVVVQYRRDELAGLLREIGPHVAALLSIVPETFSYALSELNRLRVPVIATNHGSFAERIEDGVNGWLIEATATALAKRVAALAGQPEALETVRKELGRQQSGSLTRMVKAYNRVCPARQPGLPGPVRDLSLARDQASSAMHQALRAEQSLRQARGQQRSLEQELAKRSRWASEADEAVRRARQRMADLERQLEEHQAWAREADQAAETARQRVREVEAEIKERTAWAKKADAAAEAARKQVTELEALVEERTAWAKQADAAAEDARKQVTELEALVEERTAWAQSLDAELEDRRAEIGQLRAELGETMQDLVETRGELAQVRDTLHQSWMNYEELERLQQQTSVERDRLQGRLDEVLASHSWRMTRPLRVARRILISMRDARAYNPLRWPLLLSKLVRYLATVGVRGTIQRLQAPGQAAADTGHSEAGPQARRKGQRLPAPPRTEAPEVSIVIPVHNQWAYTRQCLESIAAAHGAASCEIIVVNDASSDETREELDSLEGIHCLHNAENLGFIRSCNRGLEQARGEFVVILNNDTEVRDGWLDRMLDTFDRVPDAGLVGAKLVYPDGSLQECGGLIFQDGSGWNYGRHDDPERPEYQFLRETDYCSGACIMLRTATFRELGGFDTHYAPAYYEDTDLSFRVRALGQRVLVQPAAVVVHHEGITSGTDIASGTKRYQEINREKFLERWGEALQLQPPPIHDPDDAAVVRRSRDHRLRGRVLVIDATTPEPDQDSGSVRLTNLMQCFQDLGYGVTFFADNRVHAGRYTRQLQQAGVEALYLPWLDSLNGFFEQRGADFDYVFISRHYIAVNYLGLLKRHCPDAPFIFDTVDLHYLREQRLAELENSASLRQVARQTRRSELGIVAAADATVVVSPAEVEVLARDAPGAMVHVLSNIHELPGCRAGFDQRRDLFFVGGYQHPPNIDAAKWFVGEIWPRVRERLPDARFHLIGSKATEEVSGLAGDGVVFHGFVEDLEHYLDHCRLAVAPLRYGAGVKGKVNMSMSYGQPVVATPIAVEGMYAENGREVLVAETAEAFAEQVIRLYQDEALWNQISAAAIENVRAHFSLDAARRSLASLLEALR